MKADPIDAHRAWSLKHANARRVFDREHVIMTPIDTVYFPIHAYWIGWHGLENKWYLYRDPTLKTSLHRKHA